MRLTAQATKAASHISIVCCRADDNATTKYEEVSQITSGFYIRDEYFMSSNKLLESDRFPFFLIDETIGVLGKLHEAGTRGL